MQSSTQEILPIIGTEMDGGYYGGRIIVDSKPIALIVPPKAQSEHEGIWIDDYTDVPGALSYSDGLANTQSMAAAGSALAQKALDLRMYIPSLDELEILYRNLKPTTDKNSCWARSGINLSAIQPTQPYTPDFPLQTNAELFKEGGAEAYASEWYWTSTQHASGSDCAWCQHFDYGSQRCYYKVDKFRARFVRRLPL
jgi:hypothetical protein